MGRSARNTRATSDSRERALGEDAENGLEHSKGDLRKSLSHPRSLAVPGGLAGSAGRTRYWGLTEKQTPLCKFCPCVAAYGCCGQARPDGTSALSGAGGRSPVGSGSWPGTQAHGGCGPQTEKTQSYRTPLTLSSSGT